MIGWKFLSSVVDKAQKLLPHNLRLHLSLCQYPAFMDKEQIEGARRRELRMFEVCLYKFLLLAALALLIWILS